MDCVEAAVRDQDMAVRVEAEQVAEDLYGNNGTGTAVNKGSASWREIKTGVTDRVQNPGFPTFHNHSSGFAKVFPDTGRN